MNQTYQVKRGDTLYGISNQFGVSVNDLLNVNNLTSSSVLQIGQILTIPSASGTNPNSMFMYIVKPGDSLYSIARKYSTTVDELVKLNNLKSNNLSINQVLKIPENYTNQEEMTLPNYINYTVKRGDNLYSIARQFNLTPQIIIQDNALNSNILSIGQNLKIRVMDDAVEECFGEDFTPPVNIGVQTQNYTVKKGDSLYSIARQFNTSVSEIANINNLTNNNLSIGQVLKIPISQTNNNTYVVKSGDTLYSIARKFNTTIDNIKQKNNLANNSLSIGQTLKI